jgi:hypothetical protein
MCGTVPTCPHTSSCNDAYLLRMCLAEIVENSGDYVFAMTCVRNGLVGSIVPVCKGGGTLFTVYFPKICIISS